MKVVTNKLHQGRVMGVYIDSISEFVYSVGEDKKFKVYDLRKNELVAGNYYSLLLLLLHSRLLLRPSNIITRYHLWECFAYGYRSG